ncbi:hypothetical protein C8F01DRAFT_990008 [Mycena amicta]|nr:hypothetical protein C8F01DRAFT_990008 [Mycena amicta]
MPTYSSHTIELLDGVEIFYTDSGAPQKDPYTYTTMLMLHGTGFNGESMNRLHDHAHTHNLRIILWNRRDYRGSTPYTDIELEDLRTGNKLHFDKQALQIASFFEHLIDVERIPMLSADRKRGGIILGGWSMGVATGLALLAAQDVLPKNSDLYAKIEPYFKGIVLYDPPSLAFGVTVPDEFYKPFSDPDLTTLGQIFDNFKLWVSSYSKHPDLATGTAAGISYSEKRTERCTVESWSEEEKERFFEENAAARSELPW